MSTKEVQEQIVANMQKWQKIENASVAQMSAIIEKTQNPVIQIVMEIIQRDSQMHHRVQQMITDSLEREAIVLTPDDLGKIWDLVEKHIAMEEETIKISEECLAALKGKKMVVQEYLLNYLKVDEEKHDMLLETLDKIKSGMYPYG
jgi:hypothetical protein